ncbi:hypothetical protein Cgig2_007173 [Carnegiea gigantea]|uniref:Uncharacterized protein n=1 Tax=Carnegiea gigantea TaxID=171969 RepID=A0A9Q1Q683_9CARY|nr:hypothetical protein Cgig2_007173 [Carnegiea gigantea]
MANCPSFSSPCTALVFHEEVQVIGVSLDTPTAKSSCHPNRHLPTANPQAMHPFGQPSRDYPRGTPCWVGALTRDASKSRVSSGCKHPAGVGSQQAAYGYLDGATPAKVMPYWAACRAAQLGRLSWELPQLNRLVHRTGLAQCLGYRHAKHYHRCLVPSHNTSGHLIRAPGTNAHALSRRGIHPDDTPCDLVTTKSYPT